MFLSLSLYIYIYIYVSLSISMCIYIYIYIYICMYEEPARAEGGVRRARPRGAGYETMMIIMTMIRTILIVN